jgi:F0F1-type ATP synthase assembly protein I
MRIALQIVASLVLSPLFLFVAAAILDRSGLMSGWAFWHGGFGIVLPFCPFAAFIALFAVPWFRRGWS